MSTNLDSITVFVVNLEKDIEKKEHMLKLCKAFSLNCHFIDAVYGKSLSEEEIGKHYAKEMATKYLGRGLSRGEIGCLLSHKHIYQIMIDEEIEQALILEDDCEFSDDIEKVFDHMDLFPNNWELVLLGHKSHLGHDTEARASIWWKQHISTKYKLIRPSDIGYGTHGYLINNKGARKLLSKLDQYYKPIDHYTGNDREINVYAISPVAIKLDSNMSQKNDSMDDRADTVKRMVADNKTKKLSLNPLLRSLGLFDPLVSLRDSFKMILPIRRYK